MFLLPKFATNLLATRTRQLLLDTGAVVGGPPLKSLTSDPIWNHPAAPPLSREATNTAPCLLPLFRQGCRLGTSSGEGVRQIEGFAV